MDENQKPLDDDKIAIIVETDTGGKEEILDLNTLDMFDLYNLAQVNDKAANFLIKKLGY